MLRYGEFNSMKKTKLLVADDDVFFQNLIESLLAPDYDLVIVEDGMEAWHEMQRHDAPRLAILDWVMPGLSGPQICRKVRASESLSSIYLILLTARNNESDIVSGLRAGADDYITKPPLPAELRARIKMGERVLALQDAVRTGSLKRHLADGDGIDPDTAEISEYCLTSTGQSRGFLTQVESHQEGRHSKH
jgi:DNA-binding response OmpR family regulator